MKLFLVSHEEAGENRDLLIVARSEEEAAKFWLAYFFSDDPDPGYTFEFGEMDIGMNEGTVFEIETSGMIGPIGWHTPATGGTMHLRGVIR